MHPCKPPRVGVLHWRESLMLIKTRIHRWRNDDSLALWSEVIVGVKRVNEHVSRAKGKVSFFESLLCKNASRACRAVEDGQYRKALQFLTSASLAPPSREVIDEMLSNMRHATAHHFRTSLYPHLLKFPMRMLLDLSDHSRTALSRPFRVTCYPPQGGSFLPLSRNS